MWTHQVGDESCKLKKNVYEFRIEASAVASHNKDEHHALEIQSSHESAQLEEGQSVSPIRQQRYIVQNTVTQTSVVVVTSTSVSVTVVKKTVNLGGNAQLLCIPSGFVVC